MEKHEPPQLPDTGCLPRPIVLRPEDLASVAAGASLAVTPSALSKIIIAGGLPATRIFQQGQLVF